MKTKEFIEKAIEGGYLSKELAKTDYYVDSDGSIVNLTRHEDMFNISEILLDPKAWEAVGKVEGWRNYIATMDKKTLNVRITDRNKSEWKYNMQQMIPALIEGKSIEEYLKTL